MQNKDFCKDFVKLEGQVQSINYIHNVPSGKIFEAKLLVTRTSGIIDTLTVFFNEYMATCIRENDFIQVSGTLRTYTDHAVVVHAKTFRVLNKALIQSVSNNYAEISGLLVTQPVLTQLDSNRRVVNCIILVEYNDTKRFTIPCVFWNEDAEKIATAQKGQVIEIKGRLTCRSYSRIVNNVSVANTKTELVSSKSRILNHILELPISS